MSKLVTEVLNAYSMLEFLGADDKESKKKYLDELKDYTLRGEYTNTKHKEYLLRNYLKPIKDQMLDLDLSRPAIYKNRKSINIDLERRVGTNIVQNIINGEFDEVNKALDNAYLEQPLTRVIMSDVVETVNDLIDNKEKSNQNTYDLIDCADEIKFLKKYAVLDLETSVSELDVDKINYLFRLLNYEETNIDSRIKLLEIIKRKK